MSESERPQVNRATYILGIEREMDVLTEVSTRIERYVKGAREQGASWAEIAGALGVSKQAAHEKYGQRKKESDGAQIKGQEPLI